MMGGRVRCQINEFLRLMMGDGSDDEMMGLTTPKIRTELASVTLRLTDRRTKIHYASNVFFWLIYHSSFTPLVQEYT